MCEGATDQEFFAHMARIVAEQGWAIQGVGSDIRALQVVWADDRGPWPWHGGFRGGRGGQPVLGPRAPS
ncbi:MAG TPA: hypothetical protein VNA67_00795 [Pseudonocardiaceae bacterium]|nr:hypothetical protein [Pseudonocardiaceae bacterium]